LLLLYFIANHWQYGDGWTSNILKNKDIEAQTQSNWNIEFLSFKILWLIAYVCAPYFLSFKIVWLIRYFCVCAPYFILEIETKYQFLKSWNFSWYGNIANQFLTLNHEIFCDMGLLPIYIETWVMLGHE
jgi:hypothetical protein